MLQADGNVVLHDVNDNTVWATNTTGRGGNDLVMQADGNLVLYDTTTKKAIWNSVTYDKPGAYLMVQADTNPKGIEAPGTIRLTLYDANDKVLKYIPLIPPTGLSRGRWRPPAAFIVSSVRGAADPGPGARPALPPMRRPCGK